MKHFALSLSLAAGLLATSAVAQTAASRPQTPPQNSPAAAATLPNAFDAPVTTAPPAAPRQAAPAPTQGPVANANNTARAETALRTTITAIKTGQVNYAVFTPDLSSKLREQSSQMGSLLNQFGDIKTITHMGDPNGADMFRVEFTNQLTEWVIGFDDDGKIAVLLFRPAEA